MTFIRSKNVVDFAAVSSRNEAVQIALGWDLSNPIEYLVTRKGMDKQHALRMAEEYRRYMGILANDPNGTYPISDAVDEMWHTHMIFSGDYTRMSNALIGEYMEHEPILVEADRQKLVPQYHHGTLNAYARLYGEEPSPAWWPHSGAICICGRIRH